MKKRSFIFLTLAGAILLWWLWPREHSPVNIPSTTSSTGGAIASANHEDGQSAATAAADTDTTLAAQAQPLTPASQTGAQQRQVDLAHRIAQNSNVPIQFYGVVLDQDDQPIPGVKVTLSIRTAQEPLPGAIRDEFVKVTLTTDPQGKFSITDAKGALLTMKSIEKEGYEASVQAVNRGYWYWRSEELIHHPDAGKPEVFRMWKKAGAERLVRKGISAPLRYDGLAATFNLVGDQAADDLRVTLTRNPRQITLGQRNYEWTFTIEVPGGGLIESQAEQMYRAPAEGYQPRLVFQMPADAKEWADEKTFELYLKLRNGGAYGRATVKVLVGSDRQTTPFYITSYINPSGSRNLEYDPLQNVTRSRTP
jgi:hypothetical protein